MKEAEVRKLILPQELQESTFQRRLAIREAAAGIVPADQLHTPEDRQRQYDRLESMIGNTRLQPIHLANGSTIWRKMESDNPSGSHYDRAALGVLRTLEEKNFIQPGTTILEGTSGSAGRSFAYFCNRLGFELDMIVPVESEFPSERLRDIETFGTNIIRADEGGGMAQVIKKFRKTLSQFRKNGYERDKDPDLVIEGKPILVFRKGDEIVCAPNHSEIGMTPRAFGEIAREAAGQLPDGIHFDTFIGTLGNGATMKGITDALSAMQGRDGLTIYGTEYQSAPINAIRKLRLEVGEERMREVFYQKYGYPMPEGDDLKYHDSFGSSTPGYEPPFIEVENIDDIIVLGDEWRDFKRRHNTNALLNNNLGNTVGNTSAENLYAALHFASIDSTPRNILVLNYDNADQYPDYPPEVETYEYPVQPTVDVVPYVLRRKAA